MTAEVKMSRYPRDDRGSEMDSAYVPSIQFLGGRRSERLCFESVCAKAKGREGWREEGSG